jgi:hemolysin activation/secretion protein
MAHDFRTTGHTEQQAIRRRAWHFWVAFISLVAMTQARAADEKFAVLEYRVLHNSVLSPRQIEAAVYPHLGPDKTLADVQAARADLEKAYHDAGYSTVFVDIPEQSIENGVVRLQVTEGKVERVRVLGTRYFANRRILAAMPSLTPGEVPYFPEVQADLQRLNRASPDLAVVPVLRAGSEPGTMDVDLKVKDDLPLHASAEFDNRYTPNTTPNRVNLNLSYGNLFQREQTFSLQYQTAPADTQDTTVISGTYVLPVGQSGDNFSLYGVKTNSNVAAIGTLGVIGKGYIAGTRYTLQLPTAGSLYPSLVFGLDYKDFQENEVLSSGSLQSPIKYLNWSALYGAALQSNGKVTTFDVGVNFGIRGLLNSTDAFENKRSMASPNYFYLHGDATHEEPLPFGTKLALRLSGQFTTEPLIDNEQFAIGGVGSVRGYLESEALGDMGANGSIELRSPSLPSLFGVRPREAYIYVFYDGGIVAIIDPLPLQSNRMDLLGYGVGFRIAGYAGFDAGLDWTRAQVTTLYERSGDMRIQFHVRYAF